MNYPLFRPAFYASFLKLIILPFVLLIASSTCYSQRQAANWPFSPVAGIRFVDGQVEKLKIDSIKASRIGDVAYNANGKLLFYTDGDKVWDADHLEMPHCNGLKGEPWEAQTQIVPNPVTHRDILSSLLVEVTGVRRMM